MFEINVKFPVSDSVKKTTWQVVLPYQVLTITGWQYLNHTSETWLASDFRKRWFEAHK